MHTCVHKVNIFCVLQEEEKAAKKKAVAAGLGGKEADTEVDLQAEEEVFISILFYPNIVWFGQL